MLIVLAAMYAGLAGAIYAHYQSFINPEIFGVAQSRPMYRDTYHTVKPWSKSNVKFSDKKKSTCALYFHTFNFRASTFSVCPVKVQECT